jgi:hypothetical protein
MVKVVLPRADLVVEGPVVSPGPGWGATWKTHTWTVKNVGKADAPATDLRIRCQVVYKVSDQTYCGYGKEAPGELFPVPPLSKGTGVYVLKISKATNIAGAGQSYHRFRLAATVDPKTLVSESNEKNNRTFFVVENFSGALPPKPLVEAGDPATVQAQRSDATVDAKASASVEIKPRLTLVTDKPWKPGQPVWVIAKNLGPAATPAAQVRMTCKILVGGFPCSFYGMQWQPRMFSIPALKKNEFHAFFQFGTVASAPHHQATFHPVGVAGQDLVLKTQ